MEKFAGWICLGWLCKEGLFVYSFIVFICLVILCKSRFLKARIRKCLRTFSWLEAGGLSKERQSLFTLLALLHFKGDLRVFWVHFRLEMAFWASRGFRENIWSTRHCCVFLQETTCPKYQSSSHNIIFFLWKLALSRQERRWWFLSLLALVNSNPLFFLLHISRKEIPFFINEKTELAHYEVCIKQPDRKAYILQELQ
jgi:hypothetical protein